MNIFAVPSAQYFCYKFQRISAHTTSFKTYVRYLKSRRLREGTNDFEEFRAHLLRNVERCLFLATSQYRRSLDLMLISSAPWAHITLYYGALYAATAFLGMFGGWIDAPYMLVEVSRSSPGSQELTIYRNPQSLGRLQPHRAFWKEFYDTCTSLLTYVDPGLRFAIQPVSGDPYWLIDNRNSINYDSYEALDLSNRFARSFNEVTFPISLPGRLNTQYQVTEALILLAFSYAQQFCLNTDGLDMLGAAIPRHERIKKMIFETTQPRLEEKAKKTQILV